MDNYSEELQALAKGTDKLDKQNDFGFENLQSIVGSMPSTRKLSDQKLFDSGLIQKFHNLLSKIDNDYSKAILNAIKPLKGDQQVENFLDNILNQKDSKLVNDFFAFAFDDKQQSEQKLEYTKKFFSAIVGSALKNYETQNLKNRFLSSAFRKYFVKNINDEKTIENLDQIIRSVKNFIEDKDGYLSKNPQVSLDVLTENAGYIKDKDDLVAFFTSVTNLAMGKVNEYENRKLLADLKDIFCDDAMHKFKDSYAITHIKSVVRLLAKLDSKMDIKKYNDNDYYGLGEVLYMYEQNLIRDKIKDNFPLLQAILAFQAHYGWCTFNVKEKQNLFKRLVNIKNHGLQDQDKEDLKDYFWSHATEIFRLNRKITEDEAKEFYGFISDESNGKDVYFERLAKAINDLKLNGKESMSRMLNQDDNFKNILILKNGKNNEEKTVAYKAILKSLVKQKLNPKGGFAAFTCFNHCGKKINDSEITDKLQSEIVEDVSSVLGDKFKPDSKILVEAVNDLKDNDSLSDFWKFCHKKKNDQVEEKDKDENKLIITINNQPIDNKAGENNNIDDKGEILSELSDIFIDLINNNKEDNKNEIQNEDINNDNKNGLNLLDTTKKFVASLYQQNKENEKNDNLIINTNENEKNNQVKKDDTGITDVLQEYYKTIDKNKLSSNSLGVYGGDILNNQIKNFHKLDNDQKIKLLRCMKNIKNNKLTNDDLSYINLCVYKTKSSTQKDLSADQQNNPFTNLKLVIDSSNGSEFNSTLVDLFTARGGAYMKQVGPTNQVHASLTHNQVESVIPVSSFLT